MTRRPSLARETFPYRRHVGGVTWTRSDSGVYSTTEYGKRFQLFPVLSGRGGSSGAISYRLLIDDQQPDGSWPLPGLMNCLRRAGVYVRRVRAANEPDMRHPDLPRYPEHEKLKRVADKSQEIGEFLEWLGAQGIFLATADERTDRLGGHVLVHEVREKMLARYFQIDLNVVETEKRAMLAELRKETP